MALSQAKFLNPCEFITKHYFLRLKLNKFRFNGILIFEVKLPRNLMSKIKLKKKCKIDFGHPISHDFAYGKMLSEALEELTLSPMPRRNSLYLIIQHLRVQPPSV